MSVPEWIGVHLWKWQPRRGVVVAADGGAEIDVTGPEGIIVQKLHRLRDGGEVSERQWRDVDVVGVPKTQLDDLRLDETRRWAREVGVDDLIERRLGAAGF